MSSHPSGYCFTSYSTPNSHINDNGSNNVDIHVNSRMNKAKQSQTQQRSSKELKSLTSQNNVSTSKHQLTATSTLSDSETDISTSAENLSVEQRYVAKNTTSVQPQGQENVQDCTNNINENSNRCFTEHTFSSNTSPDFVRYSASNRSLSESHNPLFVQQIAMPANSNVSNRNSLKEMNSNRSSIDISTSSYNTLIIHNEDSTYSITNREYLSSPPILTSKKERPRSYGEQQGGMQEITEIPDDYLNQSHVLKHLAKEIKTPSKRRSNSAARNSGVSENTDSKHSQKMEWIIEELELSNKLKSKSQPDLTKLTSSEVETFESLAKENAALKQQLLMCCMKAAKTQKLEDEVSNIYCVYEELVQSCERREKLERIARLRLQENLQKVQSLNRALKDQVDLFQTQLLAPSEHQILIAQLFTQNKELSAAKERQDIELAAQQATLQEQRTHIGILDTALNNAQRNIRRLEEELGKKQLHIERLLQLVYGANVSSSSSIGNQIKQNERNLHLDYETEISQDSNRSGSSIMNESKWQLQENTNKIISLENEHIHLEDQPIRQSIPKLSLETSIPQETDRIIAEVKHNKLRDLEEVHSAQRKVGDLQTHLNVLEYRMAEKDALIRALQNQKIYSSSFDSYNLSSDTFALNQLRFKSPSSINASNTSFNSTTNTSLLEPTTLNGNSSSNFNSTVTSTAATINNSFDVSNYGQSTTSSYNQKANLESLSISGSYSPNSSSNYGSNYDPNSNFISQNSTMFNTSSSYDDHMKKQNDEHLSKFETLQRGLCCFPSLSNKKPSQSLLSDEISVLSTSNSTTFLQKLAHLDQRERLRQTNEHQINCKNKNAEIMLLEKQGRCSQNIRNNASGNLSQVTQSVGQNMIDISNIADATPNRDINKPVIRVKNERGNSLPPSSLPRPPRGLRTPRKIEYDRLSDSDLKTRSQTSHKLSPQNEANAKAKTLKLDFRTREYENSEIFHNNAPVTEKMALTKPDVALKPKSYGTIKPTDIEGSSKFGFKNGAELLKHDYSSTKKYRRLEDSPKSTNPNILNRSKRSLLPGTRKVNTIASNGCGKNNDGVVTKNSGDLSDLNINNSNKYTRALGSIPLYLRSDTDSTHLSLRLQKKASNLLLQFKPAHSMTNNTQNMSRLDDARNKPQQPLQDKNSLSNPATSISTLPPKPIENKFGKRGNSLSRNENRYRIQF